MLCYTFLHERDLNENGKFRNGKLIIRGYIILHRVILTEMNMLKLCTLILSRFGCED